MCSRHRPLDEADRFVANVDVIDHAAIVVLGFGAGYHVQRLAERVLKTSLIIAFEPDLGLLRAVLEQVDHSAWIAQTNIAIIDDPEDRAGMAAQLNGAEGIVAQGTTIQPHLPSKARLGESAAKFGKTFADLVSTIRTTILTTLVHSTTTCRNLSLNLDHYSAGEGIAPLEGVAAGRTALLLAAGPSLARHYDLLADAAVRDRVVVIAVQSCLRPLLRRGIRPHFVTALDYHEISRHFYDDLNPDELRDITLVCEPKVNRIVIESYPGPIRCVANNFLDKLLGPLNREMGSVPAGSTVAHLSFYLAQYLGCDPIVLVGQDLGFTDGLYYGPGAAIHDQWAPEVNPFNTIDMMEWSRVARMKRNLREGRNQSGRPMLVDEQMSTYLTQFERDFSTAPQTIIDAAGGGVAKQHTVVRPLEQVVAEASTGPLPDFLPQRQTLDANRLRQTIGRLESVRRDVSRLEEVSLSTKALLGEMLDKQQDSGAMSRLFQKVKANQKDVDRLGVVHDLVNLVNQLGVFKRLKADRRLELSQRLTPIERQRAQLERDQTNVSWLAEACAETGHILEESLRVLNGESVETRISERSAAASREPELMGAASPHSKPRRIAAMVAVDPRFNGLRIERAFDPVALQTTLNRLGRSRRFDSIILIVPRGFSVEESIELSVVGKPVVVREVDGPVFDDAQQAVGIARRWSSWSWRGGIGGMSIYDEVICAQHMDAAMAEMGLDAAVIVGCDWTLVDCSEQTGCDALVARYLEHPDVHRMVFTQAPPGLCGILIDASLMREMTQRVRQFTIGAMLSYIPSLPQLDPISKDACVKLPAAIRNHIGRFVCDTSQRRTRLDSLGSVATSSEVIARDRDVPLVDDELPQQLELELTSRRSTSPFWLDASEPVRDMPLDQAKSLLRSAAARNDLALTLAGRGDPLLYPHFVELVRFAREVGCSAIQIRTDLPDDFGDAAALLDLPIDVITIDLQAESAAVYRAVMGVDRFDALRQRVDDLINTRNERAGSGNALLLPWIVPRLTRCSATLPEMRNFFDRWIHYVGAAMIDPVPNPDADPSIHLSPPPTALREMSRRLMRVRADGVASAGHPASDSSAGALVRVGGQPLEQAWAALQAALPRESGEDESPVLVLEFGAA